MIDRPIGTYHRKHKSVQYSLNYGYVKGIMVGDKEEQDAYIMGVKEPLQEFEGVVIAVIHRLNDVEDKWVVAPTGQHFTKEEIIKATYFAEKYYHIEVIC